jgi:hypothetical protein
MSATDGFFPGQAWVACARSDDNHPLRPLGIFADGPEKPLHFARCGKPHSEGRVTALAL